MSEFKTCKNCKHSPDGNFCYAKKPTNFPNCWTEQDKSVAGVQIVGECVSTGGYTTSASAMYDDIKEQLHRIEELAKAAAEEEQEFIHPGTLSLGSVIEKLRELGNVFTSWYGVNTNIASIELVENDSEYKVIVKTKEE